MSTSNVGLLPRYRLHKASGQAVVTHSGRDVYLGRYDSPESQNAYDRVIGEWLASGRRALDASPDTMTLTELLAAYWEHAKGYYQKDGKPTSTLLNIRKIVRDLRALYGTTRAAEFSPRSLRAIMERLVSSGLCRTTVNDYAALVKAIFRWGVRRDPGDVGEVDRTTSTAIRARRGSVAEARDGPLGMLYSTDGSVVARGTGGVAGITAKPAGH